MTLLLLLLLLLLLAAAAASAVVALLPVRGERITLAVRRGPIVQLCTDAGRKTNKNANTQYCSIIVIVVL